MVKGPSGETMMRRLTESVETKIRRAPAPHNCLKFGSCWISCHAHAKHVMAALRGLSRENGQVQAGMQNPESKSRVQRPDGLPK